MPTSLAHKCRNLSQIGHTGNKNPLPKSHRSAIQGAKLWLKFDGVEAASKTVLQVLAFRFSGVKLMMTSVAPPLSFLTTSS